MLFFNKIIIVQKESSAKLYILFIILRVVSIIFINISISVSKDFCCISINMTSIKFN